MDKDVCTFCNRSQRDCVTLKNGFICDNCLDKITKLKIDDESYEEVKDTLKDILFEDNFKISKY